MTVVTVNDLRDFSERVERLCDFLLAKADKDGTEDIVIIQKLKEDAADLQLIQFDKTNMTIQGLSDYMKGAPVAPEKKE